MIEEVKAQEALNHMATDVGITLDGEGAQDNFDVLDEGSQEFQRPTVDFSNWLDDNTNYQYNSKGDDSKIRTIDKIVISISTVPDVM